jgi:hypothetical protein
VIRALKERSGRVVDELVEEKGGKEWRGGGAEEERGCVRNLVKRSAGHRRSVGVAACGQYAIRNEFGASSRASTKAASIKQLAGERDAITPDAFTFAATNAARIQNFI